MNRIFRRLVCAALFSLAYCPAEAGEGLYLRLGGGISLGNDGLTDTVTICSCSSLTSENTAVFDPGIAATAAIGYAFHFPQTFADLRLELEGSYQLNDVDRFVTDSGTTYLSDGAESEAIGGMVNGYLDIRTNLPIVPYVGAGAGLVRVSYEVPGGINDSDNAFAYQLIAGFHYPLIDTLAVGIEYRIFKSERLELGNTGFSPTYEQQSAMMNISLGF